MLSSCLANAAPDAGQALRDVESRRLNLPAPVELDAERPSPEDGVSRAAEEGGPTVLVSASNSAATGSSTIDACWRSCTTCRARNSI